MAYFSTGRVGVQAQPLDNYPSSAGAALDAAVQEAWVGNPTQVLGDYLKVQREDEFELQQTDAPEMAETVGGAAVGFRRPGGRQRQTRVPVPAENRFSQSEAHEFFAEQGVKLSAPSEGLSKRAAQTLVERKREEMIRQDTLARAPGGVLNSGARLAAGLGVSLLDPLNVASAFVPVVGQARYAGMLERAGASAWARAGVRARVGGVEGLAGAAMLEPFVYAGRTQLQDDYDMSDSLLNLAFGTVLGGGLHVVGGRVSDHFRGVQKSLPSSETIDGEVPLLSPENIPGPAPRQTFSYLANEPTAPFARLSDVTPDRARALASSDLVADFRAELVAESGAKADPGAVAAMRSQISDIQAAQASLLEPSSIRDRSKAIQQGDRQLPARAALARAREQAEALVADSRAQIGRLEQQIEANRAAERAGQELVDLDSGAIPERFADRISERAKEIQYQAALQSAIPARHVAALAGPQAREHALRVAVAQAMSGKNVDVGAILRGAPEAELRSVAQRQASPASSAAVDLQAAEAANLRMTDDVARADVGAAQADLDGVMAQFDAALTNLEQGGFDAQRVARIRDDLKAFDEMQKDAQSLGAAARAAAVCGLRG